MLRNIALGLLLGGCTSLDTTHAMLVTWHKVDNAHEVCQRLSGRVMFFKHIKGCARWSASECAIYAPDFQQEHERDKMATLGHELKHCFDGKWHQ